MKKAEILSFLMVLLTVVLTLVLHPSQSLGQDVLAPLNKPLKKPSDKDLDRYIRKHVQFQRMDRDDSLLFKKSRVKSNDAQQEPAEKPRDASKQKKGDDKAPKTPNS